MRGSKQEEKNDDTYSVQTCTEEEEREENITDSVEQAQVSLLEQEKKPLSAMFKYYATKRSMNLMMNGSTKQMTPGKKKNKYHPTMFMTWPNFSKFCFDFSIIPDLLSKKKLRNMYALVLPHYSSNQGLQLNRSEADYQYAAPTSPETHPALSFQGFMKCLTCIACESSLDRAEEHVDHDSSHDGHRGSRLLHDEGENRHERKEREERERPHILSLLQWMERSRGKTKISQRRSSMVIEPFRSTVTPIKRVPSTSPHTLRGRR